MSRISDPTRARPEAGSPAPKRARLSPEERRRQVIDSYAYLIATRGYSRTSLRDLARQVGVSMGTLLHHFGTKEDLLAATLVAVSSDFQERAHLAAAGNGEAPDKLMRIVRTVLESPRHDIGWRVWIAFWHEAALNPTLSPVAITRNELWEVLLASVIEEGRRSGSLSCDDARDSASELAAVINGVAIQRYAESAKWTPERAVAVVERLVRGWATRGLAAA